MEQSETNTLSQETNIRIALENIYPGEPCYHIAKLLHHASNTGNISFNDAKKLLHDDLEETLLSAVHLRLLVPARAINDSLNWVDTVLLFKAGEIYKMPHIVKQLVLYAETSGCWDPDHAISSIFYEMGEPSWNLMPMLARRLCETAIDQHINGFEIARLCSEIGLADRAGALILEFKGVGIFSPKFDSFTEIQRAGSPIYEINRAILYAYANHKNNK